MSTPLPSSEQIRQAFLDFFREKAHEIVPSAPIVPHGDPTLLFTNAGMNQFKDVFLGTGDRPYHRAADTQKCLRVSGKHNDLEEVGHDTYHHTFFEMLGNWSFGDYFKREAIRWAWELLVDRWGLDPDRLYATVHEGDERLGLEADEEAANLWKEETGINPDHVLYFSSKDNFWMMGDTGPCGPCSEIHIDLRSDEERAETPGKALVNADDPRVMEIWNLVFIQYNAQPGGSLEPLKAQHVDTGMGFERVVAVLQQKASNYDTDLFAPLLQRIAELSPREEIEGYDRIAGTADREKCRIAMRVVADHIRAIAFTIADGATPGNVGRGYVIRRILRRAVRYGYQTLGLREPFLYRLVAPLKEKMSGPFPELAERQDYIERVIKAEEESFLSTLSTGIEYFNLTLSLLNRMKKTLSSKEVGVAERLSDSVEVFKTQFFSELVDDAQTGDLLRKAYRHVKDGEKYDTDILLVQSFWEAAKEREIPGEVAFLLHDTYGFPIDLTQLMAREEGLDVDMERYDELMRQQKERARQASSFEIAQEANLPWVYVRKHRHHSNFVGYDRLVVEGAHIWATLSADVNGEERPQVVLTETPFYAESGGQVGDTGVLEIEDATYRVLDTQKLADRIVHHLDKPLDVSHLEAPVEARVDADRRQRIKKHHTATHLLHAVLREELGSHVQQKGSLVAPDRLRFDFSHFERIEPEHLRALEHRINEAIQRNIPKQEERAVPIDEALARGAMALFGEKYGDKVRVITFDPGFSIELCGGTHVDATGEIGLFRFLSEGSVAAGVRRVEAVAGPEALRFLDRELDELARARAHVKTLNRPLDETVAELLDERKQLEKELEALRLKQLASHLDAFINQARDVGGVRLVTGRLDGVDMSALRDLGERLRDRLGSGAVGVLGATDPEGDKVYLVATVADDLIRQKGLQAGALVGTLAKRVGGGGGGRPALATAGGRQPEQLEATLDAAGEVLQEML